MKTSFIDLVRADINSTLDTVDCVWSTEAAITIVAAAPGYGLPEGPTTDAHITGWQKLFDRSNVHISFAGVRKSGGVLYSSGGRVLCIVAKGKTVAAAQEKALQGVDKIYLRNKQVRRDIGYRAFAR